MIDDHVDVIVEVVIDVVVVELEVLINSMQVKGMWLTGESQHMHQC